MAIPDIHLFQTQTLCQKKKKSTTDVTSNSPSYAVKCSTYRKMIHMKFIHAYVSELHILFYVQY
jgi:hypothetical protein